MLEDALFCMTIMQGWPLIGLSGVDAATVPYYVVSNATVVGTERLTVLYGVRQAILLHFFQAIPTYMVLVNVYGARKRCELLSRP
jgi:hypothetical protein